MSNITVIFCFTMLKTYNTTANNTYKFIHWVMRIAHNLIVDHFRRVNKMPMVSNNRENGDVMETLRVQEENIEKKMIQTQMQRDIRKLIKIILIGIFVE